jgi:hypothetical protein
MDKVELREDIIEVVEPLFDEQLVRSWEEVVQFLVLKIVLRL